MSNFLAIATVTAALSNFLQGEVGQDVEGATVTTFRPDVTEGGIPSPRLNIYAYQVTPNGALRNADVATRRSDGSLIQRPQVALDIHYLLSFYGNEAELVPQRMLGSVARTLHARPVLTRAMIQAAVGEARYEFLSISDLAEQVERVRFTPIALNLEELSKLWSVFFQVRYTISVAYQASVVLIESDETPRTPLPVRDRNLYILPFRQPIIEQVQSSIIEQAQLPFAPRQPLEFAVNQPIVYGSILKIIGKQLQSRRQDMVMSPGIRLQDLEEQNTLVRIGETEVAPTRISETEIEVAMSHFPIDALRAGIQGIQVVQPLLMGTPPVRHGGLESNVAAIVLRPTMTVGQLNITHQVTRNHTIYCTGTLTLRNFIPCVGKRQRVVLLLNEFKWVAIDTSRGYQFKAPPMNGITTPDQESTDQIEFEFQDVAAGMNPQPSLLPIVWRVLRDIDPLAGFLFLRRSRNYLVRVQVDGAESLLAVEAGSADLKDQQYAQPQVVFV